MKHTTTLYNINTSTLNNINNNSKTNVQPRRYNHHQSYNDNIVTRRDISIPLTLPKNQDVSQIHSRAFKGIVLIQIF